MLEMTSRERVREALEHREPDRVPIDFGAMRATGIHAIAYNNLKKYLGIKEGQTKVCDLMQQLAEPEMNILEIMGGDVLQLHRLSLRFGIKLNEDWKPWRLSDGSDCLVPEGFNPMENEKGELEIKDGDDVIAKMPRNGLYFDKFIHPYENVKTKNDIDKIPLSEITEEELNWLEKEARKLYEETDYALLGNFGGRVFGGGGEDWGYERYYIELGLDSDLIKYYLYRLSENYLKDLKKYLECVGKYIDIIMFGDDLGSQNNSLISVDMYKKMIKPHHTKLYRYVRDNYPKVKVFLHSDGSIYNLIPELIDAGVEILNPVQISAANMDPKLLKRNFGKDLVFWGGGCNTQTTLNSGTVEDVKEEVEKLIKIFAPGGGYVFNQVHNIQANVSPEKIMAMYETAQKVGGQIYKNSHMKT